MTESADSMDRWWEALGLVNVRVNALIGKAGQGMIVWGRQKKERTVGEDTEPADSKIVFR